MGFFKRIQQGGTVKDLKFENINIKSTNGTGVYGLVGSSTTYDPSRLGVLAGEVREGHVINCSVTDNDADVDVFFENSSSSGVVVGGLIGYGSGLDIENSFSEGLRIKVVASNTWPSVGGLVGHQGVCLNHCSIGSSSTIVGKIKQSYSAYQDISVGSNFHALVGGLIGLASFGDNYTFQIESSYAWGNNLISSVLSQNDAKIRFGGLVGSLNGSLFNTHNINTGNLEISNSYASKGDISISTGFIGGLLGYHNATGTVRSSLVIKNSFSNIPFMNLMDSTTSYSNSSIGGFYGTEGTGTTASTDFSESYYTGKISCVTDGRDDICGGLGGNTLGFSRSGESTNFNMQNLYSAAEIQQVTNASIRMDNIGLLFSGQFPLLQSDSTGSTGSVLNTLGPATNAVDNPSLYFRREGITTIMGVLPGDTESSYLTLKSINQPCYVLITTTDDACLGLAVDPDDSITVGNRSLTPTQFQAVPSNSTVATGTSPALGNEFLYTSGWCPRVCRDGSSSCTETSNTLVGFDENGNSLPGPGGGLKAQAQNEGRNCFEPCFEFEGNSSGVVSNTIKAYRCEVSDVKIPENTTSILADAFKDKNITSITFPESLVSIGNNAFSGNDLGDIIIPSGITSIGDNAFSNNSSLTSVCIETQEASIALGTTPFGTLASSSISYESDGDCSN